MTKNVMLMVQEEHFVRNESGEIYATRVLNDYLLERYAKNFKKIIIFARFDYNEETIIDPNKKITLSNVEFCEIPEFRGPKQMFFKFHKILKLFKQYSKKADVIYFRTPSLLSLALYRFVPKNKFVGIEFMMGAEYIIESQKVTAKFINYIIDREAKNIARRANATLYVTENKLQESYPPNYKAFLESEKKYFTIGVSDVELLEENYSNKRCLDVKKEEFLLISVGFMDTYRKGQHILIEAVNILKRENRNVKLILVGDGKKRKEFEETTKKFNLSEDVCFTGKVTDKEKLKSYLEAADIFLLPSTLEGLPRVIIEAMAAGLPVIASNVNGNSELVQEDLLVDSFLPKDYAEKINSLISNKNLYDKISNENYNKSKKYSPKFLDEKRNTFYEKMGKM